MNLPISIILSSFNNPEALDLTLRRSRSLLLSVEQIVLKDGSNNSECIDLFKSYDFPRSVIISGKDNGLYYAWNIAIKHCISEYVLFLNSGDYLDDLYTNSVIKQSELGFTSDVYFCDVLFFKSTSCRIIVGKQPQSTSILSRFSIGFPHPGSITKLSAFYDCNFFDTNYKVAADFDLLLKIYLNNGSFSKIDAIAHMESGGVSDRKLFKVMLENFIILNSKVASLKVSKTKLFRNFIFLCVKRYFIRFCRNSFVNEFLRFIKHFVVFSFNIIERLLLFHFLRRMFFKMLGFKLSPNSSIGHGVNFYNYGNVSIGFGSVINKNVVLDNRDIISISNNVSISRNVSIFTAGHNVHSPLFHIKLAPVFIEDNVVVFSNVIIQPGTIIKEGAVVLPGAVCNGVLEPFTIYGGVPARKLGTRNSDLSYQLDYCFPLAQ